MTDEIMLSYVKACATPKATVRYSAGALLPVTIQLMREYAAKAERNPAWLTVAEHSRLVREVNRAASLAAKDPTREHQRRLFYATARRDAFKAVLTDTEPGAIGRWNRRPPGMAQRLARARYMRKLQQRNEPVLILEHEELKEAAEIAARQYAEFACKLTEEREAHDARLAERRIEHAGARSPRGSVVRLATMADEARRLRKARDVAQAAAAHAWRKLVACRKAIVRLSEQIAENEKIF